MVSSVQVNLMRRVPLRIMQEAEPALCCQWNDERCGREADQQCDCASQMQVLSQGVQYVAWTSDGRLVMLARTPTTSPLTHAVIAMWRPGDKSLAVRSVHIPARNGGSDSFIAWVRPGR